MQEVAQLSQFDEELYKVTKVQTIRFIGEIQVSFVTIES